MMLNFYFSNQSYVLCFFLGLLSVNFPFFILLILNLSYSVGQRFASPV